MTTTLPGTTTPEATSLRRRGGRSDAKLSPAGYVLHVGPVAYTHRKDGTPIPLADMVRWAHGTGHCTLTRADGTVVVRDVGRGYADLIHEPTGTRLRRDVPQTWRVRRMLAVLARQRHGLAA